MKKLIFSLFLLFITGQSIVAQDINKLMQELAKEENVKHMVADLETFKAQLESIKGKKRTAEYLFITRLAEAETIALSDCSSETIEKYASKFNSFKDGDDYGTIIREKGEENKEHTLSFIYEKDKKTITAIYIFSIDEKGIIIMKMAGNFTASDIDMGNLYMSPLRQPLSPINFLIFSLYI